MSENVCPECHTRTGIPQSISADGLHEIYWCFGCGDDYLIRLKHCDNWLCHLSMNDCPICDGDLE